MNPRILIVDDDATLLRSIERNLCFDYDVTLAESGPLALAIMSSSPPFAVVITDMRMPKMTGLEFIPEARKLSPDSSYVMLTGNQDLETAVNAVNQGQVFRFLNKPVEMSVIRSTIDAGHRQYMLVTGEKELLNKTCAGAISMMLDLLEVKSPDIGMRLANLKSTFEQLRARLDVEAHWEFTMASRLAFIGFTCLGDNATNTFLSEAPNSPQWRDTLESAVRIAGRMVLRIPRLGTVGEIIANCTTTNGVHCHNRPSTTGAIVQTGATLLYVAILWDAIVSQGVRTRQALVEMRELLPEMLPCYEEALEAVSGVELQANSLEISVNQLTPGMVLSDHVCAKDGAVLLRSGTRLSMVSIERLTCRQESTGDLRPIKVFTSAEQRPSQSALECLQPARQPL